MKLKNILFLTAGSITFMLSAAPASAQGIPVYDNASYLQMILTVSNTAKQVENGIQQIEQAQQQFNSLSKLTNVNSLATSLIDSQVRNILPNTDINAQQLLSGDFNTLGSLGNLAQSIQNRYQLTPSNNSSADAAYNQAVQNATKQAAIMAALGENTLSITTTRMKGLEDLRNSLSTAKDPKDVLDIQARIAVENAHLQNDILKLKSIEMARQNESTIARMASQAAAARDSDDAFAAATTER